MLLLNIGVCSALGCACSNTGGCSKKTEGQTAAAEAQQPRGRCLMQARNKRAPPCANSQRAAAERISMFQEKRERKNLLLARQTRPKTKPVSKGYAKQCGAITEAMEIGICAAQTLPVQKYAHLCRGVVARRKPLRGNSGLLKGAGQALQPDREQTSHTCHNMEKRNAKMAKRSITSNVLHDQLQSLEHSVCRIRCARSMCGKLGIR